MWTRAAMVAVALAWVVAVVAAQCWLPQIHRHATHSAHPLVTSVGKEFAVNTNHAHLTDNPSCPKQFATAALPRPAAETESAGAVVTATASSVFAHLIVPAGRGPPAALSSILTGRELLTRFCLARR
ncbi:hypothetical protein H7I94_27520 [Mycobacterium szulgai]|nr:hypothetical protein [Mycobacterium szulgai]